MRGVCGLDSREFGEGARWVEEVALFVGEREPEDFVGDLVGDLVGEDGCDDSKKAACWSSSSSAEFGFLDDILEKNFICEVLQAESRQLPGSGL